MGQRLTAGTLRSKWIKHIKINVGARGLTTGEREELGRPGARKGASGRKEQSREMRQPFRQGGRGSVNLFGFIDAEEASYPVSLLCRALKVSRSGWRWARAV